LRFQEVAEARAPAPGRLWIILVEPARARLQGRSPAPDRYCLWSVRRTELYLDDAGIRRHSSGMTVLVDSDVLMELSRGRNTDIVSQWMELSQSDAAVLYYPMKGLLFFATH
jgi:hypothetical protein